MSKNILNLLPEVFFLMSYLLLFIVTFFLPLTFSYGIGGGSLGKYARLAKTANVSSGVRYLGIVILIVYLVLKLALPVTQGEYLFFGALRVSTSLAYYQSFVILLGILLSSFTRPPKSDTSFEFWLVYFLLVFSCAILPMFSDLLGIYLIFELQGFCAYILAAMHRSKVLSIEASLKYFVLGAFISGFFLFGLALLYMAFGSTKLYDIMLLSLGLEPSYLILLGFSLILGAFLFKLAAFPFHIWVSDVYSGITLPVLTIFATLPKASIWGVLLFQFYPTFLAASYFDFSSYSLYFCGLFGIVVGSFSAIYQNDFKKFIAYSGVSNMGYILVAFSLGNSAAIYPVLFYTGMYTMLLTMLLVVLLSLGSEVLYKTISSTMISLFRSYTLYGFFISLLVFSMAGIPPLLGFFPKFAVISAVWSSGHPFMAICVSLVTVLSAAYYVVFFVRLYFSTEIVDSVVSPSISSLPAVIFSLFNLLYLLFHNFFSTLFWVIAFGVMQ